MSSARDMVSPSTNAMSGIDEKTLCSPLFRTTPLGFGWLGGGFDTQGCATLVPRAASPWADFRPPLRGFLCAHAAFLCPISFSILLRILEKEAAVQLKGCATSFHSLMNFSILAAKSARSAKLGATSRLRRRIENYCSTWFIQEQWTGV